MSEECAYDQRVWKRAKRPAQASMVLAERTGLSGSVRSVLPAMPHSV